MEIKSHASMSSVSRALVGFSLALFTCWDYYLGSHGQGTRLFDLLGIGLLFILALIPNKRLRIPRKPISIAWWAIFIFEFLFIANAIAGVIHDPGRFLRPISGVLIGTIIFLIYCIANLSDRWLDRTTGMLMLIHSAALILQMLVYYLAGYLINYQQIAGAEPGVFYSMGFRPTGLFIEPNSYVMAMTMLFLLRRIVRQNLDFISWITICGMILSVSLFGILAVGFILVISGWRRLKYWALAPFFAIALLLEFNRLHELPQVAFILHRFNHLDSDLSVTSRMGQLFTTWPDFTNIQLWLGGGLGSDYHSSGLSGFGFLLANLGILGTLALFAIMPMIAPKGRRVYILCCLLFLSIAAPIWTIMFWWAWLGLLCNRSLIASERKEGLSLVPAPLPCP